MLCHQKAKPFQNFGVSGRCELTYSYCMMGYRIRQYFLTSTAIIALAVSFELAEPAHASDIEPVGNLDLPTAYISFEGGIFFDASSSNIRFDKDDSKLGDLGSLQPGDWGGQGRFELGQQLNNDWDYRVGISAVFLSEDTSSHNEAEASQKTDLQTLDLEVGYRPEDVGPVQSRLFAGLRGLHSSTEADWSYDGANDKVGEFNDDVYAIGPRVGADLLIPLNSSDVALVGSASGALLFGNVESSYDYRGRGSELTRWSNSETIWNVDAMAGVSFGIGETANLTLGYRASRYWGLMSDRSDIQADGDFSKDGRSDLLVHGPFARLTVAVP